MKKSAFPLWHFILFSLMIPVGGFAQNFDLGLRNLHFLQNAAIIGQPVDPQVDVVNYGPDASPPFLLVFNIFAPDGTPFYGPSYSEGDGLPADTTSPQTMIAEQPWIPELPGEYLLEAILQAEGDQNPQNDTLRAVVFVRPAILTREQATAIVQQQLIAKDSLSSNWVGFLYQRTGPDSVLQAGDMVEPWDSTFSKTIEEGTYLFWFDKEPEKEWQHAALFAFIDAHTGDLQTYEAESWPVINGNEWTQMMQDGNDSPDRFHGKYPASVPRFSYQAQQTSNDSDWVVIFVGKNLHGKVERLARLNDIARLQECLNGVKKGPKVTSNNILVFPGTDTLGVTVDELCAALQELKGKACRKLYFHYIGHGYKGGIVLKGKKNQSVHFSYKKLARKLLDLGVREVCVTIEACYSGSAISPLKKAFKKIKGKKVQLKGTVITSSSGNRKTNRSADGAEFIKALHQCCKDPLADLNKDGKITLVEAVAWARVKNKVVNTDHPQGVLLGDGRKITFLPPAPGRFNSGADLAGSLNYEVTRVCYSISKGANGKKKQLICRKFLYVQNPTNGWHNGASAVDVVCKNRKGQTTIVHTFRPRLAPKQRLCITELPGDCARVQILTHKARRQLARIRNNATAVLQERAAAYRPGEFIFQEFELVQDSLNLYQASVEGNPDWHLSIDPVQFTTTALIDTEVAIVRGILPDTAKTGGIIEARLINTTMADTALLQIDVLVFDSLGVPLDRPQHYDMALVDLYAGIHVTRDTLDVCNSVLRFQTPGTLAVDQHAGLRLENTLVRADSGASYSAEWQGAAMLNEVTFVAPQGGVVLHQSGGKITNTRVLLSSGNGLTLAGDASAGVFDFLFIDGAQKNGLVLSGTGEVQISNARIENSSLMDVVLENQSRAHMLDCSYNPDKEQVEQGSELTRSWTTGVLVVDSQGNPLEGVQVTIRDADGRLVVQDTTAADGFTQPLQLAEYRRTGHQKTSFNPYLISLQFADRDTAIQYQATATHVVEILLPAFFTGLTDRGQVLPQSFQLAQNYPNPFGRKIGRLETHIAYALPQAGGVSLLVYNVLGQEVLRKRLGKQSAGRHVVVLDARSLAAGVYIIEMQVHNVRLRRKMVVMQ